MKILLSHPTGNANVRAALKAFNEANMLDSFHTSIATFDGTIYEKLSLLKALNDFNRRRFDEKIKTVTYTYPSKELGRLIASKFNLKYFIEHEKGKYSIDSVYNYIDYCVSKKLKKKGTVQGVYCYEDCAINTFKIAKENGVNCFYDLPSGYWRRGRKLLKELHKIRPDWSNTLSGLKDSEAKLNRKDTELLLADQIIVASSFTAQTLIDFPEKLSKIKVIPYGFPETTTSKKYDYDGNRPLKLLFVGNLSLLKGIANVLEAVENFKEHICLTIVGRKTTDDCKPLNEGLKKHHWIPSLNHASILELMRNSDVLIFPSLSEGFGLVITEAMSQGTPVITTNSTGGKDFIINNKNGWIVETDSTNSIVSVISELLNTPDKVACVGMEAIKTAASRTWQDYQKDLVLSIKNIKNVN